MFFSKKRFVVRVEATTWLMETVLCCLVEAIVSARHDFFRVCSKMSSCASLLTCAVYGSQFCTNKAKPCQNITDTTDLPRDHNRLVGKKQGPAALVTG